MLVEIALSNLQPDPRNANYCTPEIQAKILKHIQRTGRCPFLTVRPHPAEPGMYIVIDGHHRLLILKQLDWSSIGCQVWDIGEEEAALALTTLNRLRGTDDFRKRSELIDTLVQNFGVEELASLIPESTAEIQDMLALLRLDEEALEQEIQAQREAEEASLPVPFTFMVSKADSSIIEDALAKYAQSDRGASLVSVCKRVLEVTDGQ